VNQTKTDVTDRVADISGSRTRSILFYQERRKWPHCQREFPRTVTLSSANMFEKKGSVNILLADLASLLIAKKRSTSGSGWLPIMVKLLLLDL